MVRYIVPVRTVKGDTKSDSKIVRPLDSILVLIISFTTYTFTCLAWGLLLYFCTQLTLLIHSIALNSCMLGSAPSATARQVQSSGG